MTSKGIAGTGLSRRAWIKSTGMSTIGWSLFNALCASEAAGGAAQSPAGGKACSLILLWMDGGPSQLETFDPHPGSPISGPTTAIETSLPGVKIASGLPRLAEQMHLLATIRSVVGTESDHDRARYLLTTGQVISPSVAHPSLGSICSAMLPNPDCELPGFMSINTSFGASRSGFLGVENDPLNIGDPKEPPKGLASAVDGERMKRRLSGLDVIEQRMARLNPSMAGRTMTIDQTQRALRLMRSPQAKAFRMDDEPRDLCSRYGDTAFGRGCLVARRLIEAGVRCVEVQLGGWDSHVANFTTHATLNSILDPAFSTLLLDLQEKRMLDSTLVVWLGEFGRTPAISPSDGRDHWPHGFSVVLAGGGMRPGIVVGETDPQGVKAAAKPVTVPALFATLMTALGVDPANEHMVGERPVKLSEGKALSELLTS